MKAPNTSPIGRFLIFATALLIIWPAARGAADGYAHLDPATRALLQQLEHKYKSGMQYLPGYGVEETESPAGLPQVFAPTRPRTSYTKYPWKREIITTVFWVGESARPDMGDPGNMASSWDTKWLASYGGHDDPNPSNRTWDFRPKDFVPGQNPFYIALPYNDLQGWKNTKPTAKRMIPWYKERFSDHGDTVIKGQWLAIRLGSKICYAQWEDVGPFETDDWQYVFGDARPKTDGNGGAGLDVSPAVRDFLGLRSGQPVDWRFVDLDEVPTGPWRKYGDNNPFLQLRAQEDEARKTAVDAEKKAIQDRMVQLREARDAFIRNQTGPKRN